jgi:hypothetical protein
MVRLPQRGTGNSPSVTAIEQVTAQVIIMVAWYADLNRVKAYSYLYTGSAGSLHTWNSRDESRVIRQQTVKRIRYEIQKNQQKHFAAGTAAAVAAVHWSHR